MLTEILNSPAVWLFGIGTVFAGGGIVYMASETTKKVKELQDSKVDKEDCCMKEMREFMCETLTRLGRIEGKLDKNNGKN